MKTSTVNKRPAKRADGDSEYSRTTKRIRQHIARLKKTDLFTSKDLSDYGTRNSVHHVMHRLVEQKLIRRIARGVFAKSQGSLEEGDITALDVAKAKAKAFGKWCLCQTTKCCPVEIIEETLPNGRKQVTVPVHGCSSSFMFGDVRIVLQGGNKLRR
ncbi:MAG TPA: DUF6088 family protein [Candidatus Obscuribacterales bacterium]